ncbi:MULTISPECIES: hypothetical protein [unclassified Devosia]|uniref:hypothetical protein n=1 Tax=unclassified Devosia TaxID=196773 RepID=UPI00086D262E|nr:MULTISPECIES: hypothetical protein [unclassified Devosia]MBN9365296.1 hypothetical protein [Devosia sp.]ODS90508.1 MAG: hypothetical protein ABS47_08310 [Devosia sp. SCN 66-27]OJX21595.1 MAG: hypothetical protein BGO83_02120 [Devosia sp. 66-14]
MPTSRRTPRLLLRIRTGLKRLDLGARPEPQPLPPDRAWHEMLARLDAEDSERRLEDAERRLAAMERALNGDR